MLLEFKVRNFRSFREEQVFTFPASSTRVAVVFGPSGAGKTNLILALAALRDLVLKSATTTDSQYANRYQPFQFRGGNDTGTDFEVTLQLDDVRYRYTVSYDAERILLERLQVYRTGKPQRWFERMFDANARVEVWAPFSPSFRGSRELWRRMTHPKTLFLTTATGLDCEQVQPLFQCLDIRLGTDRADVNGIAGAVRQGSVKPRILEILDAVDIPVRDIRVTKASPPEDRARVEFLYEGEGAGSQWVDSENEAHGTLRLLNLLPPMLRALDHGGLLAIDEFDAGLHPLVAGFLVQLAKRTPEARAHPQFLLVSHDAALMVPETLKHEEIWLMERNSHLASHLLSVADRRPRKRVRLVRGYLRGRYGAIPHIREIAKES